ncbi:calcium-transporting ATPase 9, plasma membrane-type-like protein isoform X2 [Tanacetum coccineum]
MGSATTICSDKTGTLTLNEVGLMLFRLLILTMKPMEFMYLVSIDTSRVFRYSTWKIQWIAKSRVPLHRLRIVRFSNGVRYALTSVRYGNMTYVVTLGSTLESIGAENAEVAHSLVGYADEVKTNATAKKAQESLQMEKCKGLRRLLNRQSVRTADKEVYRCAGTDANHLWRNCRE